jgi:hypothetical protein
MDWSAYEPFESALEVAWEELSRDEAEELFGRVMDAREERIRMLERLLIENGNTLDESNDGVARLESWFREFVTPDSVDPDQPHRYWLSVAFDIGIFLGELMTRRRHALRWEMLKAPEMALSYQRPVIVGFADPEDHVDPTLRTTTVAHRSVVNEPDEPTAFLQMLWNAKATEDWSPRQRF